MGRKSAIKMVLLFATALFGATIARADPDSPEQIDKLKRLGAKVTLDDEKRVIGVNLGERKITDADLVHLKGLTHLQELDLTRTKVTTDGLVNLKDLMTLKKLYLTDTKVDDSGIAHLKGMKSLEVLGLSGTMVSDAALEHLDDLLHPAFLKTLLDYQPYAFSWENRHSFSLL